jgi:fructose-1,6-bisphosphatase
MIKGGIYIYPVVRATKGKLSYYECNPTAFILNTAGAKKRRMVWNYGNTTNRIARAFRP